MKRATTLDIATRMNLIEASSEQEEVLLELEQKLQTMF
jgi:hypothetical protein